jgi:tetratricopeptide (TPR) repeat protein
VRPLALLCAAAAALTAGCDSGTPPPPPPSPPSAVPAPAPVPVNVPVPAPVPVSPRRPADPQDEAFEFQMTRARDLAARAAATGDLGLGKEAFDAFQAASRIRPKDPVPPAESGLLALELGDGAHAARMLAALQEAVPDSGAFHFLRGCLLEARNEFQDGIAEFRAAAKGDYRAREAEDHVFRCSVGLGLHLGRARRNDEAIKVLNEAVAARPDDPLSCLAYYNLAVAYRRTDAPQETIRVLKTCMEKFPTYAPAYGELGDLLADLGRFDEAVDVLQRSVKADQSYGRGWLLLADVQTMRGKYAEADESLAEYDRRFPADADSEFFRGIYLRKKGEPKAAIERFQKCLAMDPGRARAIYFIAQCYRDLGDVKKSEEYVDRWKKAAAEDRRKEQEQVHREQEALGGPKEPGK